MWVFWVVGFTYACLYWWFDKGLGEFLYQEWVPLYSDIGLAAAMFWPWITWGMGGLYMLTSIPKVNAQYKEYEETLKANNIVPYVSRTQRRADKKIIKSSGQEL